MTHPMSTPPPSTLAECRPRPIFVHTLDRGGDSWQWFLGFPLDRPHFDRATPVLYFERNTPRLLSVEHYDHRCSAHYWFEITEITRVRADIAQALNTERWSAHDEATSFAHLEALLRLWNTGAI